MKQHKRQIFACHAEYKQENGIWRSGQFHGQANICNCWGGGPVAAHVITPRIIQICPRERRGSRETTAPRSPHDPCKNPCRRLRAQFLFRPAACICNCSGSGARFRAPAAKSESVMAPFRISSRGLQTSYMVGIAMGKSLPVECMCGYRCCLASGLSILTMPGPPEIDMQITIFQLVTLFGYQIFKKFV